MPVERSGLPRPRPRPGRRHPCRLRARPWQPRRARHPEPQARLRPPRAQRGRGRRCGRDRARAGRTRRRPRPFAREAVVARDQLEDRGQRRHLELVDRHLGRDRVGKLREPARVADDERLAERERPDRHARGLAHGRPAQADAHVAVGEQLPEIAARPGSRAGARLPRCSPASSRSPAAALPASTSSASGKRRRTRWKASRSCGTRFAALRWPRQATTGKRPSGAIRAPSSTAGHAGIGTTQTGPA